MLQNILMLGVPWLAKLIGTKKTYVFAVALGGVALFLGVAGHVGPGVAILAALGAGTVAALRHGVEKIEPYIPIADKLLEHFGYADLDVVFAKLKEQLK